VPVLEILSEKKLPSGERLTVSRLSLPDEHVPERIVRYLMASLGYDKWWSAVSDLAYWRLYFRRVFAGEGAQDRLYLAEVNGAFAGRIWAAWSPRSGYGNFGNVFTEPEFRRRGIMNELLTPCVEDFASSGAKTFCCATGNPVAAAAYRKQGFQMIWCGETGPMCWIDPAVAKNFQELEERCFDGTPVRTVREGCIEDQFACDKFLAYTAPFRDRYNYLPAGPGCAVNCYMNAMMEAANGSGTVQVAENANGTVTGYAYALKVCRQNIFDLRLHPDAIPDTPRLLDAVKTAFQAKFPGEPLYWHCSGTDSFRRDAMTAAGLKPEARIPGAADNGDLYICRIC